MGYRSKLRGSTSGLALCGRKCKRPFSAYGESIILMPSLTLIRLQGPNYRVAPWWHTEL